MPEAGSGVRVGDVIRGKYRIERMLGRGGMGTVFLAEHLRLGQRIALKLLNPSSRGRALLAARFAREARLAAQIPSDHVVRILDVDDTDQGDPFFAMEYLSGSDLADILKQNGPLPVADAVDYVLQACEALAAAHELGIIHRDIKPANLFLATRHDGTRIVKLLDFGISKLDDSEDLALTDTNAVMGSPVFMSPEQLLSARDVTHLTDIWSLGVTLHQLLTGELPFEATSPSSLGAHIAATKPVALRDIAPNVPEPLECIVLKCLEKQAKDRYANIVDLAQALQTLADSSRSGSVDRVEHAAARAKAIASASASEPRGEAAGELAVENERWTLAAENRTPSSSVPGRGPAPEVQPFATDYTSARPSNEKSSRSSVAVLSIVLGSALLLGGLGMFAWFRGEKTPPAARSVVRDATHQRTTVETGGAAPPPPSAVADLVQTSASAPPPPKVVETPPRSRIAGSAASSLPRPPLRPKNPADLDLK